MSRGFLRPVHPAIEVVKRTMRVWDGEHSAALDRAVLIVRNLVEAGHIPGAIESGIPVPIERPIVSEERFGEKMSGLDAANPGPLKDLQRRAANGFRPIAEVTS